MSATPVISEYTLDGEPRTAGSDDIRIVRTKQMEGPPKWAIRRMGACLNKSGDWECEPMPSSRDDAFLARCRFASPDEAFAAIGLTETALTHINGAIELLDIAETWPLSDVGKERAKAHVAGLRELIAKEQA